MIMFVFGSGLDAMVFGVIRSKSVTLAWLMGYSSQKASFHAEMVLAASAEVGG